MKAAIKLVEYYYLYPRIQNPRRGMKELKIRN